MFKHADQMTDLRIKRIEHIGIATAGPDNEKLFERILGRPMYKEETVDSENVLTQFFQVGQSKIELLSGRGNDAITKFVEKRGPGIHHIAFEVENIQLAFDECQRMGLQVLNDAPKEGADNKLIFFIHPKSAGGVLIEFCQDKG